MLKIRFFSLLMIVIILSVFVLPVSAQGELLATENKNIDQRNLYSYNGQQINFVMKSGGFTSITIIGWNQNHEQVTWKNEASSGVKNVTTTGWYWVGGVYITVYVTDAGNGNGTHRCWANVPKIYLPGNTYKITYDPLYSTCK